MVEKYKITPSSFRLSIRDIESLNVDQMTDQNRERLKDFGGVPALLEALLVDAENGLSAEEEDQGFAVRRGIFGENRYPEIPPKSFLRLFIESFNDTTLMVLIAAAVVSLIVGMIEDSKNGWIEGVAILIAILIVALVTATNDYSKEKQFRALNALKDDIQVKVMRNGEQKQVSTLDLNVGEIVVLETGDKVPADGILIQGDSIECNESALTGEPEDIKKSHEHDPFLLSGCQVTSGYCSMVVIAVGSNSRWGRIKAKLVTEAEETPLQEKLDDMAKKIGYLGTGASVLTFIGLMVSFFLRSHEEEFVHYLIESFIICITIIVVAIPEGLPLAVTISLAYSTRKMLRDNNLIRVLAACETMGNATNICSDKTGTLTENRMTVVEGWFAGKHYPQGTIPKREEMTQVIMDNLSIGVSLNSTAFLKHKDDGTRPEVIGNKTEGALLMLIENWGVDFKKLRIDHPIEKLYLFSSARKMSSILYRKDENTFRLYCKGASEIVLKNCINYIQEDGSSKSLDDNMRIVLGEHIFAMADRALRTIGLAHRDFTLQEVEDLDPEVPPEQEMTCDAIVGIIDPLREDVRDAVSTCQAAGIMVRMVTGDNIHTAKAIARDCGILMEGGEALEGPAFRAMTPEELDRVLPRLQVLARSSPSDKHLLVTRLNGRALPSTREEWEAIHPGGDWVTEKDKLLPGYLEEWKKAHPVAEVVGVTGDGTNDAPALKAADVGLSMGLSGTEVAKEASDIVIMDDRFSSIVKAVLWGRCVYDNIRKFLQFQLTVNVVALTVTFVAAFTGKQPPLNAVMMLWVNLIMDTMGALALGTETPRNELLNRKPYVRNSALVSKIMAKNILVQSAFQLVVLFVLLYAGHNIFEVAEGNVLDAEDGKQYVHYTIIFNAFVFCQVFNEINARRIGNELNIFQGFFSNALFSSVLAVTVALQFFIVQFGGQFTRTSPLTLGQWLITIAIGFFSLPIGIIMRFIPVEEDPKSFSGYDFRASLSSQPKGTPAGGTGGSGENS